MNEDEWRYEFEQSLEGVADFIVERLQTKIDEHDLKVTGNLRESIEVSAEQDDDTAILSVEFADYGLVLNKGLSGFVVKRDTPFKVSSRPRERSYNEKGGRVGIKYLDIFDWTKARGIKFANTTQKGTASIITRALRRDGYVARPWLDEVLIDELPEIDRRIEKALDNAVQTGIDISINEAFSNTGRR